MPTDAILSTARHYLGVDPTVPITLEPIKRGASGRTIVRVKSTLRDPFIGMHWTDEREDNERFVPVARFLKQAKLPVPEILHDRPRYRVALIQDLGDVDLLSLRDSPFEKRIPYYESAMKMVDRLFYVRTPKEFELMPPFDAELYRWEQEYFFDHFVEGHLGMDADSLRRDDALASMAVRLGSSAKHLVHRDFQSQNLMIRDDAVWMIDFQGLRRGRQEYDLASLIYDPYMNHSPQEREALLELWEEIADERPEPSLFRECAAQRLMQALGAYSMIVAKRGNDWYRQHIPIAARLLADVTADTVLEKPLASVLAAAV